jgi:hypothetical protein
MFCSAGCALWLSGGFFSSLEVFHGGLRVCTCKYIAIFDQKSLNFFAALEIFFNFLLTKTLNPDSPKRLDPGPDADSIQI